MSGEESSTIPKRALIAGCGYIGSRVVELLSESGSEWETNALVHSAETAGERSEALGIPVMAADLADPESLSSKIRSQPDVVVHCASSGRGGGVENYRHVYREGCRTLAETYPDALLLFTSSTSVYPQTDGSDVDEGSPAEPDRETGRILREAEEIVLAKRGIVARLSGIFGPGRSVILRKFLEGSAAIEEDGRRFLNQIHRDDAARAIVHLLELGLGEGSGSARVRGEIFNVADDEPMTQGACYRWMAQHFGRDLPPTVPRDLNRKRGWTHKRVRNDKLRATGWRPRYPSYQTAIEEDPDLVASIRAQVGSDGEKYG